MVPQVTSGGLPHAGPQSTAGRFLDRRRARGGLWAGSGDGGTSRGTRLTSPCGGSKHRPRVTCPGCGLTLEVRWHQALGSWPVPKYCCLATERTAPPHPVLSSRPPRLDGVHPHWGAALLCWAAARTHRGSSHVGSLCFLRLAHSHGTGHGPHRVRTSVDTDLFPQSCS